MTPLQTYEAIIDQLVKETRFLGGSEHVAKSGIYSNSPDHKEFNSFIASLTSEQRKILSKMIFEERHSAIHDVLAMLTWWLNTKNVGLSVDGVPMPTELSGMGLHGDYVGRCEGWSWPDEKA